MEKRVRLGVSLGYCLMALLACAGVFRLLAQEAAGPGKSPDEVPFDFSIYFIGNVRANLEPCG